MKTSIFKRSLSMFMAMLLCFSGFLSIGTTTAYAAKAQSEVFVISFPRDGDANYSGHWGHDSLTYMNGWTSGKAVYYMKVRTMGSTEGNVCYCIEPGVPLNIGDKLSE